LTDTSRVAYNVPAITAWAEVSEEQDVLLPLEQAPLGNTGLVIGRLGFGTLPMGPLQANLPLIQGAAVIRYALEQGVSLIDTAAAYRNFGYVREALRGFGGHVIIASKTAARTYQQAELDIQAALREMGIDRLDICHLHGARVMDPFVEREEALRCLLDYQAKGYIGAVGISTHVVRVVRQAARRSEIQVIHPLINQAGLGIIDGSAQEMADAISEAHDRGKGIYAMKVLGGGNLLRERESAIRYVLQLPGVDAAVVGMLTTGEVDYNLAAFSGQAVTPQLEQAAPVATKRLVVLQRLCQGCGDCVAACPNTALSVVNEKCTVDAEKCLLCGYCGPSCKQFAIRVV
jgi:aryl-alcohol dehydrogenase-like predicted oxidoreductase/NAD-dependent dihydropyrimidine dehydrogenase PreA subunit